jgi:translation initiation factor IF-1
MDTSSSLTPLKNEKESDQNPAGDRVTRSITLRFEKGRLIFRHKDERAGSLRRPPQRHQFRRR